MTKADLKPVEDEEVVSLIKELTETNYDNVGAHCRYDGILERYCLYPDLTLAPLMEQLICEARGKAEFWYE